MLATLRRSSIASLLTAFVNSLAGLLRAFSMAIRSSDMASFQVWCLSFLVATLMWSGAERTSTSLRWCCVAMTIFLLPWFQRESLTLSHLIGTLFILWSGTTLLWTSNVYDGIGALVLLILLASVFVLGARMQTLMPAYVGFASGMVLSSIISVAAALKWLPPASQTFAPEAGLFFNVNIMGEAAALAAAFAFMTGYRVLALLVLPAVVLCGSRGVWIACVAMLIVWLWRRSRDAAMMVIIVAGVIGAIIAKAKYKPDSTSARVDLFWDNIDGLTLWGRGLGSYATSFFENATRTDTFMSAPLHAHFDLLQMWSELGPGALLFVALIVVCLTNRSKETERVVLVGFLVEGLFAYPAHAPATAFIAALVMGHLCRDRFELYRLVDRWRCRPSKGSAYAGSG